MATTLLWDFGNVLIRWDPRNLYRHHFDDPEAMERFLATVWTPQMNARLDAGEPLTDLVTELAAKFPEDRSMIELYDTRWTDMVGDTIPGAPELVAELRDLGIAQYGLSNWSTETFDRVADEVEVFRALDGWLLSGQIGICKPDPRIFQTAVTRFDLDPATCLFVDDTAENCAAARSVGIDAVHFVDTPTLRDTLRARGIDVL